MGNVSLGAPRALCVSGGPSRLKHTVPLCLFGDEGKGPKRGNYMVTTMESPLGLADHHVCRCTCKEVVEKHALEVPMCYGPVAPDTAEQHVAAKAATNYKSHSYLTRHILFGLPDSVYKDYPHIYQDMLALYASELKSLFCDGMECCGQRFYVALLGNKGDLKHMAEKVAHLTRSYAHMGKTNMLHMCSLCMAGGPGYPWDELAERPAWVDTLFHSRPWDETPHLCTIPFDDQAPEALFRLDLFHLIKVGLGRDIAGAIVLLCRLKFFDDGTPGQAVKLSARLHRAHKVFRLWCLANHKSAALRYFSPAFFNVKRLADFPWSNSKGSDTTLLLDFLRWYCSLQRSTLDTLPPHLQMHRKLLKLISSTSDHCLKIFDVCNSHGLWLPRTCAQCLWVHIQATLAGYQALAKAALEIKVHAFGLKPKWHGLQHVGLELQRALECPAPLILSPLTWACEMNEDHIGKICNLALKVSTRTINVRVLQRHFLKTSAVLRRHVASRRKKALRL